MRSSTSVNTEIPPENSQEEFDDKIFEYTGEGKLTVRGISTGTLYHFRFKGEKVAVNYYDSFAMMAEPDLKAIV